MEILYQNTGLYLNGMSAEMKGTLRRASIREDHFLTPVSVFEFIIQVARPAILSIQRTETAQQESDDEGQTQQQEERNNYPIYVLEYSPFSGVCTAVILSQGLLPIRIKQDGQDQIPAKQIVNILEDFTPELEMRHHLHAMLGEDLTKPDIKVLSNNLPRALHGHTSREPPGPFSQSQSQTPSSGRTPSGSTTTTPEKEKGFVIHTPGKGLKTPNKRSPPRHFKKKQSTKRRRTYSDDSEEDKAEDAISE